MVMRHEHVFKFSLHVVLVGELSNYRKVPVPLFNVMFEELIPVPVRLSFTEDRYDILSSDKLQEASSGL
jgi:hypothetical protein